VGRYERAACDSMQRGRGTAEAGIADYIKICDILPDVLSLS
jgi:hypothetical protein